MNALEIGGGVVSEMHGGVVSPGRRVVGKRTTYLDWDYPLFLDWDYPLFIDARARAGQIASR